MEMPEEEFIRFCAYTEPRLLPTKRNKFLHSYVIVKFIRGLLYTISWKTTAWILCNVKKLQPILIINYSLYYCNT